MKVRFATAACAAVRYGAQHARWFAAGLVALGSIGALATVQADEPAHVADTPKANADGRELFVREWLPNDARSQGGDGLGPVFNESSCVSCHNQGGVGGGGPESKNVDIVTALQNQQRNVSRGPSLDELIFRGIFGDLGQSTRRGGEASQESAKKEREAAKKELVALHPGFASARSVVLHRFGTDDGYESWRRNMSGSHAFSFQMQMQDEAAADEAVRDANNRARAMQEMQLVQLNVQQKHFMTGPQQVGNFVIVRSKRNPTALFGAGLIDSVKDEELVAAAEKQYPEFPEVSGRVAKLKDGKIGRFGWKAQTTSLRDFTLTACAVELGLNVPGHDQAGVPQNPDYKAPGLDLTQDECNALESYLRDLPAPAMRTPSSEREAEYLKAGEAHFAKIGCAACHAPKVGEVAAIYSDLLVHDMGDELGDTGVYGVFVPNESEEDQFKQDEEVESFTDSRSQKPLSAEELKNTIGALRTEWRTPPLWGVRDSAPYLHDGRASTLEEAIALHGGEGAGAAQRFYELKGEERLQVIAFLRSLEAPVDNQIARAD